MLLTVLTVLLYQHSTTEPVGSTGNVSHCIGRIYITTLYLRTDISYLYLGVPGWNICRDISYADWISSCLSLPVHRMQTCYPALYHDPLLLDFCQSLFTTIRPLDFTQSNLETASIEQTANENIQSIYNEVTKYFSVLRISLKPVKEEVLN